MERFGHFMAISQNSSTTDMSLQLLDFIGNHAIINHIEINVLANKLANF